MRSRLALAAIVAVSQRMIRAGGYTSSRAGEKIDASTIESCKGRKASLKEVGALGTYITWMCIHARLGRWTFISDHEFPVQISWKVRLSSGGCGK